ncbi:magnesium/cobalt transporter CorA [Propionimicrobium sp. PCR01-08-3]|uniref:magnesium/cobalt transporter CorA n=1 Tax=Propionimicrobium sp. PCR01-08-3 TaxID=3052086 RepID=UPI00255CF017|nr:magnesium/cobalt transporter CorA [Propionimicrobium sp. PCR01-08-3]WIY82393.1 magnesium/cobalt transporter CorA [Propionimicrobium sp. PCR01-08-3]
MTTDRPFAARDQPPRLGGNFGFPTPVKRVPIAPEQQPRTVTGNAIYVGGKRISRPDSLAEAAAQLQEIPGSMAWIGLYQPDSDDLIELGEQFGLHELAVEDAISAHQRSKLERYDETLFLVLRAARYIDEAEEIEFGELHIFSGANFVITVRHGRSPDLSVVRRRMEADPQMLSFGPEGIVYAILDAVVDGYAPVLEGLANDVEEIEDQVFTGSAGVSRRIYELSQEVVDFHEAVRPLRAIIGGLAGGFSKYEVSDDLQEYLRDVADHSARALEEIEGFRTTLRDVLSLNAALVAQRQNEEMKSLAEASNAQNEDMKKISAWAGILFVPTMITGIYGMNFTHMPEVDWAAGYPYAIGMMLISAVVMWLVFHRKGWI